MKFVCNGLILSEAVLKVSKACAVRTTSPIMEYIKISAKNDSVELLATDGELSILKKISAEVFEEGEICVPGKLFSDFVSKLADQEISLSTSDRGIFIGYADAGTNMQTLGADEFPQITFGQEENSYVIKQGALKKVIAETTFCCAADEARPLLKGCLMTFDKNLEIVALDGFRLALSSAEIVAKNELTSIICPARTLVEISRMLTEEEKDITVYVKDGAVMVNADETTIVSRLYKGEFVDKNRVVPTNFSTVVTVKRSELIASAERAAILIRGDKHNLVTITIGGESLKIASSSEYGNVAESVKADVEGIEFAISLNAKYLLDALKALEEEDVVISFNGAVSPFILQNRVKKESLYLILPVRNAQ